MHYYTKNVNIQATELFKGDESNGWKIYASSWKNLKWMISCLINFSKLFNTKPYFDDDDDQHHMMI